MVDDRLRGCSRVRGHCSALCNDFSDVSLSPDGRSLYLVGGSEAVVGFRRDASTGRLSAMRGRLGCATASLVRGRDRSCQGARGLFGVGSVSVSPDGRNIYAAALSGLATFARDRGSGRMRQLEGVAGCASRDGSDGDLGSFAMHRPLSARRCLRVRALAEAVATATSADGANVYAAMASGDGAGDGVVSFRRSLRRLLRLTG